MRIFYKNWAVPEKDGIDHFLTKVNQQIAHLGSTRTKEKAKKIGPTRAKKAKEWIEAALETFRKGLRGEELFEETMVQLLEPDKLVAGEVAPTASSGGLMQVSTTSISQSIGIPSPK